MSPIDILLDTAISPPYSFPDAEALTGKNTPFEERKLFGDSHGCAGQQIGRK